MKFLVCAISIAFVLEDCGTCLGKPIKDCTAPELVGLFKKDVLGFVMAALPPLLGNVDIMEGGSECIAILEKDKNPHPFDVVLATMSLAQNHYNELQNIQESSGIPERISNELVENIRRILLILLSSPKNFQQTRSSDIFKKYFQAFKNKQGGGGNDLIKKLQRLLKLKPGSSSSAEGTSGNNNTSEPLMKCFRSIISPDYLNNKEYFTRLSFGFDVIGTLMRAYDKGINISPALKVDETKLQNETIPEISVCQLKTPDPEFTNASFELVGLSLKILGK